MKSKNVALKDLQFNFDQLNLATQESEDAQPQGFSGTAYSGLPIFNHPFWGNLIFDTSNITSEPKVPVLFNHDPNRIVGFGTLRVDRGIFIDGQFSEVTPDGIQVKGMIEEGFPMKQSVFIEPSIIDRVVEGNTFSVNGQELSGPFTIFRDSKIKEVSMTPLPADSNTETHLFNERLSGTISLEEKFMSEVTEEVKKEEEVKVDEVVEEPKAAEEVVEEVKEEVVEEPKVEDAEKQFMELAKVSLAQAFKFACGCDSKAKTSDSLEDENKKLKAELADLQKQMKKQSRFSQIEDMEVSSGLKFSDDAKESMLEFSDESFSSLIKGVKVENKKPVSKELLKENGGDVDATKRFDLTGFDVSTPLGLQEAAKKFQDFSAEKGKKIDQIDAIVAIQKMVS